MVRPPRALPPRRVGSPGISRRRMLQWSSAAALASRARGAAAADARPLQVAFFDWVPQLHPAIAATEADFARSFPLNAGIIPSPSFGFDRIMAEAKEKMSTWDLFVGLTPFISMLDVLQADEIEPWDPYLPPGILDDLIPATRAEGTYQAASDDAPKLYVWPFLLDVIGQGWHAGIVEKAGLDPEKAPANWDELFANAQEVVDRGAAPYGIVFDSFDWRSLIPITHSISTDVYTPEGLFRYASHPAIQALEIMKRMMPLTIPNILQSSIDASDNLQLPDEAAFATEQVAYYIKYQNAPIRMAAKWQDPTRLRLAPLPVQIGGVGGTVFWDAGAVLFKYGQNKQQAVAFMQALGTDDRVWQESIAGTSAAPRAGQLPALQSKWTQWEATPPSWFTANPWAVAVKNGLANARAIPPSLLGLNQFATARVEWLKYLNGEEPDPVVAMQKAQDAVAVSYKKQTGKTPSY